MSDPRAHWESLKALGPEQRAGSRYTTTFIGEANGVRRFLAMRWPEALPSMFLEAPADAFPRSGLSFRTKTFAVLAEHFDGLPARSRGLALDLVDPSFVDLFALLSTSLMSVVEAAPSAREAINAAAACLARWRRFVERGGGLLGPEEQTGLIGELVVLGRIARTRTPQEALAGWSAPSGSVRDFEFADVAIEVKAYQAASGASLRINDPAQLDEDPGRPLYLAAVRLAEGESGLSLPEAIERVRQFFVTDADALRGFDDSLIRCGYIVEHAPMYQSKHVVGPLSLHAVKSGFPRIRPAEIMPGVDHVQFSIPIGAVAPFECDATVVLGPALSGVEKEGR